MKVQFAHKISNIKPLHDSILVTEMHFGERTLSSGLVLLQDDAKTNGIRPRWAMVFAVGPEQKDVVPGQWVLVEHGRWTRGSHVIMHDTELVLRKIDPSAVLLVSDERPNFDETQSTAVHAESKSRS